MDAGWTGPPYDPIALAELRGLRVRPSDHVFDARTVPLHSGFRIEYRPTRSPARTRYSIAHEIAHTFFPDCAEQIRHRTASRDTSGDAWQLEVLCNIGAAEILMPIAAMPDMDKLQLDIDGILDLRNRFGVSTEAILIRVAELSDFCGGVFAAARDKRGLRDDRYSLDYVVPSRNWHPHTVRAPLPQDTLLGACTAIGYTTKAEERWPIADSPLHIEAVGVPPYPGFRLPRVVGLFYEAEDEGSAVFSNIKCIRGDALAPKAEGHRIIAHIVNDKTPRWGGGFAKEVRKRYPKVQEEFVEVAANVRDSLVLGNVWPVEVSPTLSIVNMVAQRGYGRSSKPRVRYAALSKCLTELADLALRNDSSVHMPRIGVGQGGGDWHVVSDLIKSILVCRGVTVTVYDLPGAAVPSSTQFSFSLQ
ncbi:MAG: ImmA/IrrE family metallo-endopeptidase [Gemmatimonadetes bacterium]|nr:ImmA/IrrE family metallo-endopeptidase [Gemmatimonadota bacterium]